MASTQANQQSQSTTFPFSLRCTRCTRSIINYHPGPNCMTQGLPNHAPSVPGLSSTITLVHIFNMHMVQVTWPRAFCHILQVYQVCHQLSPWCLLLLISTSAQVHNALWPGSKLHYPGLCLAHISELHLLTNLVSPGACPQHAHGPNFLFQSIVFQSSGLTCIRSTQDALHSAVRDSRFVSHRAYRPETTKYNLILVGAVDYAPNPK